MVKFAFFVLVITLACLADAASISKSVRSGPSGTVTSFKGTRPDGTSFEETFEGDDIPSDDEIYEKLGFSGSSSGGSPSGKSPFGGSSFGKSPFGDSPFGKSPFGKSFFDDSDFGDSDFGKSFGGFGEVSPDGSSGKSSGSNPDKSSGKSNGSNPNKPSEKSSDKKPSEKSSTGGEFDVQAETKSCLEEHNAYRKKHNSPPLVFDDALEKFALNKANEIAKNNDFSHSQNSDYGENLAMSSHPEALENPCKDAVKRWYDEIEKYDFNNPGQKMGTGHFTQVVWKNSNKLGCASSKLNGAVYVVCNYDPAGNFINQGQYEANVLSSN